MQSQCDHVEQSPDEEQHPYQEKHDEGQHSDREHCDQGATPLSTHEQQQVETFPYTHAQHPVPLAEGTGLYKSPFQRDYLHKPFNYQQLPLWGASINDVPHHVHNLSKPSPFPQVSVVRSGTVVENETQNETGSFAMSGTKDVDSIADDGGRSDMQPLLPISIHPSHQIFNNTLQQVSTLQNSNHFNNAHVENTNQNPNLIMNIPRTHDPENVMQGNTNNSTPAPTLCTAFSTELHGTGTQHLGTETAAPQQSKKRDRSAMLDTDSANFIHRTHSHHHGAINAPTGSLNTPVSTVVNETMNDIHESKVDDHYRGIHDQEPSKVQQAVLSPHRSLIVDPGTVTTVYETTKHSPASIESNQESEHPTQTSPQWKQPLSSPTPQQGFQQTPAPTVSNILPPIIGANSGPFQLRTSVPEQERHTFSSTPVADDSIQGPFAWISSRSYGNTAPLPPHASLHSSSEQPPSLTYRSEISFVDIRQQVKASVGQQFPCSERLSDALPRSSSASSLRHCNNVNTEATLEKQVNAQNLACHSPGSAANTLSAFRDSHPAQSQYELYRLPSPYTQGQETAQGYGTSQPFMSVPAPFATHLSYSSGYNRDNSIHGGNTILAGHSQAKHLTPHPQYTPIPKQFREDNLAKVIEHTPVNRLDGSRCHICNKMFKTEKDKLRHVQRMHLLKGRYPCPYTPCKQSFAEAHKLSRHVRTVHLLNRPFKCPECDSSFGERGNMMQHMRKAHLGQGREGKRAKRN